MKYVTLFAVLIWTPLMQVAAQPATTEWTNLALSDLSAFQQTSGNWQIVGAFTADRTERHAVTAEPGTGILANLQTEEDRGHLFTQWQHADMELDLEVLMPRESNSGIYFMSRYEVQLLDSWDEAEVTFADLGGIYQRWDEEASENKGYEGQGPSVNVARAPGLWQHLNVVFRAPRFNAAGEKIENARFLRVALNGVVVQNNVEVTGPTRAAAELDSEVATAPLMIQGDHGPVAFRKMRYRKFLPLGVTLSDLKYSFLSGDYWQLPEDYSAFTTVAEEAVEYISATRADSFKNFIQRYEGQITLPVSGTYSFAAEYAGRTGLLINGEEVISEDMQNVGDVGGFPRREGQVTLAAGTYPVEVIYGKGRWHNVPTAYGLFVRGPGLVTTELTAPGSLPADAFADFKIAPGETPVLQRGFVMHGDDKRTHTISVGDPRGLHYSYDMNEGTLLSVWKGPFIDASSMWYQRGEAQRAIPLGSRIERSGKPAIVRLAGEDAAWPEQQAEDFRARGYRIAASGHPEFMYDVGNARVVDAVEPAADAPFLRRTLTVESQADVGNLWCLLAESDSIVALRDGVYAIDDQRMYIETNGLDIQIRQDGDRQQLLLPIVLSDGSARVTYNLVW